MVQLHQAGPVGPPLVEPQQPCVHVRPHVLPAQQFTPPHLGVPHYDTLRRLEEESRRQAQSSKVLHA